MEYHFKMPVMDRMRYTGTENKQEEMSLQMNTISSALIYNWHQRQLPDEVRLNRDAPKKKSLIQSFSIAMAVSTRETTLSS